jgi:hypothetical protein
VCMPTSDVLNNFSKLKIRIMVTVRIFGDL